MQWLADRPISDLVRYRAESYTQFGVDGQSLHDWLLRLEVQRYAPRKTDAPDIGLPALRAEFRRLRWPQ